MQGGGSRHSGATSTDDNAADEGCRKQIAQAVYEVVENIDDLLSLTKTDIIIPNLLICILLVLHLSRSEKIRYTNLLIRTV